MTGRRGRPTGIGAAVALAVVTAALGSAGCDDRITYTYFNVDVTLDRATMDEELLQIIEVCGALAETPSRMDSATLPCMRGAIGYNLGQFQYTTQLTSGSITFIVEMKGINDNLLARGVSMPVAIRPGEAIPASVLVMGIPGAPRDPPAVVTVVDGGATD